MPTPLPDGIALTPPSVSTLYEHKLIKSIITAEGLGRNMDQQRIALRHTATNTHTCSAVLAVMRKRILNAHFIPDLLHASDSQRTAAQCFDIAVTSLRSSRIGSDSELVSLAPIWVSNSLVSNQLTEFRIYDNLFIKLYHHSRTSLH